MEGGYELSSMADLKEERDILRECLVLAAPIVCSMECPSTWKTGEKPPHSDLCKAITCALAATADYGNRDTRTNAEVCEWCRQDSLGNGCEYCRAQEHSGSQTTIGNSYRTREENLENKQPEIGGE